MLSFSTKRGSSKGRKTGTRNRMCNKKENRKTVRRYKKGGMRMVRGGGGDCDAINKRIREYQSQCPNTVTMNGNLQIDEDNEIDDIETNTFLELNAKIPEFVKMCNPTDIVKQLRRVTGMLTQEEKTRDNTKIEITQKLINAAKAERDNEKSITKRMGKSVEDILNEIITMLERYLALLQGRVEPPKQNRVETTKQNSVRPGIFATKGPLRSQ